MNKHNSRLTGCAEGRNVELNTLKAVYEILPGCTYDQIITAIDGEDISIFT